MIGSIRSLYTCLGPYNYAQYSLMYSCIVWLLDFDKEIHATCLPNYIDLMNAQLLDPALTEQDDYTRQCLIGVAKRRLEDLRNCIRQQQRDRDNFRSALWETISGKKLISSSLSYRAKDTASLSEIEDAESRRDDSLLKKTKGLIELLRLRVVEHTTERSENLLKTFHINNISPDRKLHPPEGTGQFENDVELFANVRTDDAILRDDWQLDEHGLDGNTDDQKCVRIDRSVFDQILQTLKPFESHRSFDARQNKEDVVSQIRGDASDPSVIKLVDLLQSMASELELWRNRSHRLSSELKSLEQEQQLISMALGLTSASAVTDRLANILSKVAELTGTVKPAERTEDTQSQLGVAGQTALNDLDGGKNRRSSADEDLQRSRTESETIVDIDDDARKRRMSAPFMRPRPSIGTALPVLQEHRKNKNVFTYRKSSHDYSSVATPTRSSDQRTATGKLSRPSYDFSQFRQGSLDGKALQVAITADPLATQTSPNNRRRMASVFKQRKSVDSINIVL